MAKKNLLRALLLALFLILVGGGVSNAAPSLAIIQKAKGVVETARYELPVEIAPGLTLTQVSYNSEKYTLVYRYHFTVYVEKPNADAIKEAKLALVHMLKANPNSDEMQLIKGGITFHYNYYSENGTFLYAVKITPADVK